MIKDAFLGFFYGRDVPANYCSFRQSLLSSSEALGIVYIADCLFATSRVVFMVYNIQNKSYKTNIGEFGVTGKGKGQGKGRYQTDNDLFISP